MLQCFLAPSIADGLSKRLCLNEANRVYLNIMKAAREELAQSRFICYAGSAERAACLQNCLQVRNECIKPINDATNTCYNNADSAYAQGRQNCRSAAGCSGNCPGNVAFQSCMVPVRVALYNARKQCRASDDRVGRRTCRSAFNSCNKSCRAI